MVSPRRPPLIEAIERLAPGYTLSAQQYDQIGRNTDPTAAEDLPGVIESLGRSLADNAEPPFDWRLIPVGWLLDEIDFSRSTDRYHLSWQSMAQKLGSRRIFDLGKIVERAHRWGAEHEMDRICAIYQEQDGRNPDSEGLMYWLEQLHLAGADAGRRGQVFKALVVGFDHG